MGENERIGLHRFRFEPPDVVVIRLVGDLMEADVREFIVRMNLCAKQTSYLLLLADMSQVGSIAPGARKAGASKKEYKPRGLVVIGASAAIRIMANFVVTASNLLNKVVDNPVRFTATEAEGRAWLDERRRIIRNDVL